MAFAILNASAKAMGPSLDGVSVMKSTFVSSSQSTPVWRAVGSIAGGLAELFAVCIFIGAIGIWAKIIVTV